MRDILCKTFLMNGLTEVEQKILCGVLGAHLDVLEGTYQAYTKEEFEDQGLDVPRLESHWSERKNRAGAKSKVVLECAL